MESSTTLSPLAFIFILLSVRTQYLKEKNTIENVNTLSLQLPKVLFSEQLETA